MRRTNGKGDVRTVASNHGPGASGSGSPGDYHAGTCAGEQPGHSEALRETAIRLALRDDGYLRVIPDGQGDRVFIKWKFTSGPYLGQYVMAVVNPHEISHGFVLILTKIIGSYAGMYSPSVDKRYSDD